MEADIAQRLKDLALEVGHGVAEGAAVYIAPIKRMALKELTAFAVLLAEDRNDAAKEAVYAKMTAQELTAEKEVLADLAVMMADDNARKRAIATAIVGVMLKAALSALLGAVVF